MRFLSVTRSSFHAIRSSRASASFDFCSFNRSSKVGRPNFYLPLVSRLKVGHLSFLKDFFSLIHDSSRGSVRNFNYLSAPDSVLGETHLLDISTSVAVIEGLCRMKKLNRAKSVLLNLKRKGQVPESFLYSLVLQCLVPDGKLANVELMWSEIHGSDPSIDGSGFVVSACKFGDPLEIESICRRMLTSGSALRQQSYVALIGALCRNNNSVLALEVLREMVEKGFAADNLTYIAVFQCLCRKGNVYEADLILRRLVAQRCTLDVCIYAGFLSGLCKGGKLREAEKMFHRSIQKGHHKVEGGPRIKMGRRVASQLQWESVVPEMVAHETYCRSLCMAGKVKEAEVFLKEMLRKKMVPDSCVHRCFIKALFQAGRGNDAVRFFEVQKKKGLVRADEIAVSVIKGLCELGRVDEARDLLQEIVDAGSVPTASIWNCVLSGYWKQGRVNEAVDLFEEMQEGRYGMPDVSSYTVMVHGFCRQENIQEAISIFKKLNENKVPTSRAIYVEIIRQLSQCGRGEEACNYVSQMIESGHLVSYVGWKSLFGGKFSSTMNTVSRGL